MEPVLVLLGQLGTFICLEHEQSAWPILDIGSIGLFVGHATHHKIQVQVLWCGYAQATAIDSNKHKQTITIHTNTNTNTNKHKHNRAIAPVVLHANACYTISIAITITITIGMPPGSVPPD